MSSIVRINPSGDTTGATDSSAIASALSSAGLGGVVEVTPGDWWINQGIQVSQCVKLTGFKNGVNGRTSTFPSGTTFRAAVGFSGGAFIDILDGSEGVSIEKLNILGDVNTPAAVNGITNHRNVNAPSFNEVAVCLVTGHGIAFVQGSDGVDGDACKMRTVILQKCGMNGLHRPPSDSTIIDVHVQSAGFIVSGGHGFYGGGVAGNSSFVGCRSDLNSGCGFYFDHNGAFGDAIKLTGCSTERNSQDGLFVTNTSSNGDEWRAPVLASGCCFEGDGHNGGAGGDFAAVRVIGRNRVFLDGVISAVNNLDCAQGAPRYSLYLQQTGSPANQPETVEWASGEMNFASGQTGGEAIHNHSLVDHLLIGPTVTQVGGYEGTSIKERAGTVTTSGQVATVTTPWAYPNSKILLTGYNSTSPGALFVTARNTGSFNIKAATADCTVQWQIM